jgi:SAM-dependent methyltransferase
MNSEVPESSFDLITCLGFLMYVPGAEILKKLSSLLRPGGVMFIEDYIRLKESPNESETRSLNGFHCIQIRTRKEFDQHLSEAGLEVFEFIDKGRQTSEFAWNRAENFLIRYNLGECKADEIEIYADYCPRILNSVDHLGRETILERFPNLCQKIGTEPGLTADKLLTWVSLAVRKARD